MAGPRVTEVSLSLCRFVAVPGAIRHLGADMDRCSFWEVSACRLYSSLHGNVSGEWYSVFKIQVMVFLLAYCTDFKGIPTGTGCATLLAQIVPVPPDGW